VARRRPIPGSGPRCHDARHRLIAPRGCRETSLPASHHCCPSASQGVCDALDHAKITQSTADAATNSRPRSSIRRRQPRPAHLRRKPTPRQIPIDGRPPNQPPRVPSWEAFGSRPSVRLDRSRPAGIRNPSPTETARVSSANGRRGACAADPGQPRRVAVGLQAGSRARVRYRSLSGRCRRAQSARHPSAAGTVGQRRPCADSGHSTRCSNFG
jgi:hypothetical protein